MMRCTIRTPTGSEINVHNSLDEIAARDHFLNKSVEEGELLFRENSAYYQEDLMWMGPYAFTFYLQSAIRHVKSEYSSGDDHIISCLYDIVLFRSEKEGFLLAGDGVKELVAYVIDHFDKFNVDRSIYGDLLEKYKRLRDQLNEVYQEEV
jgi:hypothetical protein